MKKQTQETVILVCVFLDVIDQLVFRWSFKKDSLRFRRQQYLTCHDKFEASKSKII